MEPKEQVEMLMNELVPFGREMISKTGEFYPFGGFVNAAGDIVHVGIEKDDEYPSSKSLLDDLNTTFRRMATSKECIATAIVANVRIKPPNQEKECDAIRVSLDHFSGYSAHVFFPYAIKKSGVEYFEIFAKKGENTTFREDINNS